METTLRATEMPRQNVRKKFPKQLEFPQAISHTPGDYPPVCVLPANQSLASWAPLFASFNPSISGRFSRDPEGDASRVSLVPVTSTRPQLLQP